jgi:ubiquinone/menaquinone biosynthesis C-methylase UbiE
LSNFIWRATILDKKTSINMSLQTAERVSSHEQSDNVIFQRHLVAYNEAAKRINGNVLEVGCGEGYGISLLAPKVTNYMAVDKFATNVDRYAANFSHVKFQQMSVPPLQFPDNTFDYIVTFQVIEHIEDDEKMVAEMSRVLKPGGKMIMTTPNIKMSLTRNPWHVREYTVEELETLLQRHFSVVDMQGVYGNKKVMDYYEQNKASVQRFTAFRCVKLAVSPATLHFANPLRFAQPPKPSFVAKR